MTSASFYHAENQTKENDSKCSVSPPANILNFLTCCCIQKAKWTHHSMSLHYIAIKTIHSSVKCCWWWGDHPLQCEVRVESLPGAGVSLHNSNEDDTNTTPLQAALPLGARPETKWQIWKHAWHLIPFWAFFFPRHRNTRVFLADTVSTCVKSEMSQKQTQETWYSKGKCVCVLDLKVGRAEFSPLRIVCCQKWSLDIHYLMRWAIICGVLMSVCGLGMTEDTRDG